MQHKGIRVRFETKQIAPNGFPTFPYAPSVLTHSTVQYTAIFADRDDASTLADAVETIKSYWKDATIVAAEMGVAEFKANDLSLSGYVYGTLPERQEDKKKSRWFPGGRLPTDNERIRAATPHNPLPSTV